jgi:hypothetical protein
LGPAATPPITRSLFFISFMLFSKSPFSSDARHPGLARACPL